MQLQLVATPPGHERRARFVDYHRSGSPDLRDRLVRRHLPLARSLARRFARRGIPLDDLNQVASIGLIQAVDRFDPDRGVPFESFATPTIIGEIKHHFRDRSWDLRVPRRVRDLHLRVNAAIDRATGQFGRSPTVAELAAMVGVAEEEVVEAIDAGAVYHTRPMSLSAVPNGADLKRRLPESLLAEDPRFDAAEARLVVHGLLGDLPPREELIVRMYYWDRASQDAIAARLGVSQMHVSRLLRQSLERLRDGLGVDDG